MKAVIVFTRLACLISFLVAPSLHAADPQGAPRGRITKQNARARQAQNGQSPSNKARNKKARDKQANDSYVDAQWIWSPAQPKDEIPVGGCYFRKTFMIANPEAGQVHITADNTYELFVNGQAVADSNDWRQLQIHDITNLLKRGKNTIGVRATNTDKGAAGLVARVIIKHRSGPFEAFSTDNSWKTSLRRFPGWAHSSYKDHDWLPATSYGTLGATLPWGDEVVIAGAGRRFVIGQEFNIERIMRDEDTGSLIAMTFDAQGNILASQEGGHLLRLVDEDGDGKHDTVQTFCKQIKNVQGILALGTRVFAVGNGPEGSALYRMRDADRDGTADEITALVPFRGSKGEHGPHAVRLGLDGLLYVLIGDHARVGPRPSSRSPYRNWYEGDLVQPRYEDPQGHAVNIPAPGGTVIRTDTNGSFVEVVAGGLRNAYDFAFTDEGELFTYDADMEWDQGAPWYRPTRINHITAGAELGWRSGWAKWPEYYLDSLPATLNLGGGSPTGIEAYHHTAFPKSYHGALFACDWATGKIHCIRLSPNGATYQATDEIFVEGRPLNATDLAVGPDGALYFCTGGRDTDGGIYRLYWEGKAGESPSKPLLGVGIDRALQQPQFDADWARAKIAAVKYRLDSQWDTELVAACQDAKKPIAQRLRALDLMVYYGPRPTTDLLLAMAGDSQPKMRAKVVRLMATSNSPQVHEQLIAMLDDQDSRVRRLSCESLVRHDPRKAIEPLVNLLADEDRFVAFAARRALEQLPTEQWSEQVLNHTNTQIFLVGAVGLIGSNPAMVKIVLKRGQSLLDRNLSLRDSSTVSIATDQPEALSDRQRLDLLRVLQLSLIHGKLTAADVPTLSPALLALYPTESHPQNRELVRLLVYLQEPLAAVEFAKQIESNIPPIEKLHLGAYACRLNSGWDTNSKLSLLKFYEAARSADGGYSVSAYLEKFARDFFTNFSLPERRHLLARGERWPTSALSVLATLPAQPGAEILQDLQQLDQRLIPLREQDDTYRRLQVGVVAVLGRSGEPATMEYLRKIYRTDPARRPSITMSLTQYPTGENWSYLVDSLKTAEVTIARDVLTALTRVAHRPMEAGPYRDVILLGLKLKGHGVTDAMDLLEHWAVGLDATRPDTTEFNSAGPETLSSATEGMKKNNLAQWQQWYTQQFPDAQPADLPQNNAQDKWSYEELLSFLMSDAGKTGDRTRGKEIFRTARCASCHRCQNFRQGEGLGPDLTYVDRRFQQKEILQSIVHPSHIISDQYASQVVVVNGRTYVGLAVAHGTSELRLLLADGRILKLPQEQIDDIQPSQQSSMPDGLLNSLNLGQVADLFAYLSTSSQVEVARKPQAKKR
ncbi:MAG: HEAT repeat domain-containing protein [Pirellulales bacterium]